MTYVDLSRFDNSDFDRGRTFVVEVIWRIVSLIFFQNPCFVFYAPKRFILRLFGARVGRRVLIKPRVTITFPWRVRLGNHVWLGEGVWLDSLAEIEIGDHSCISQGAYLCTGNHDFTNEAFTLITKPILIGHGAWVAARSIVGPGVHVGAGAILGLGSVAVRDLEDGGVYLGNPASLVRRRKRDKP